MKKALTYFVVFVLCIIFVNVSRAKEEEEFPAPVEFTATQMQDLGNFHGTVAPNDQTGWYYWGGREPVVSPGWVVFPVTGSYRFVVECKSQQFTPDDKIFAEFDVRLHILGEDNDTGEIKDLIEIVSDTSGDMVAAHGSSCTDQRKGEDWAKITVAMADAITGDPIEVEEGTMAQIEIWFTNDQAAGANDRNFYVRSVAVLLPEGVKIAVEPASKLPITWAKIKAE